MRASNEPSQALLNAQKELDRQRREAGITYRPPVPCADQADQPDWFALASSYAASPVQPAPPDADLENDQARIAPTLAAWCLDKAHNHASSNLDGPYRLYKILQTLDRQGRGWHASAWVTAVLTRKDSPTFIYGRRQLKIMLRRGEGLFWNRVKSQGEVRIRLVARTKVARQVGCGRLRGKEISFPLKFLLGSGRGRQADVNAALYAAVHAGQLQGKKGAGPIARARLQEITGCSTYRQRSYEKRAGIQIKKNVHILGPYSAYQLTRVRVQEGLPVYKHIDYTGVINRHHRGAAYIARRLPNSYLIPRGFTTLHSRRQQTYNRSLDGLCHMGSGGSDGEAYVRLFHRDPVAATRAFHQNPGTRAYWPLSAIKRKEVRLWRAWGDLD